MSTGSVNVSPTNRREAARHRWKILARALHKDAASSCDENNVSVRRFTTFQLVTARRMLDCTADSTASWYQYTAIVEQKKFSAVIRHPMRNFTAAELIGFNNTGNVCVWPSEEVLAYYALSNLQAFAGKYILELGGGMTCLAGLLIAKYSTASKIHLTDGNATAIENVQAIIRRNNFGGHDLVTCSVLQWGDVNCKVSINPVDVPVSYDVILSADCLFFDEARKDLVETMWMKLSSNGIVIVMAPRRGTTFDKFAAEAEARGFHCRIHCCYNDRVWNRHLKLKQTLEYREDIHYPMLLQLTKKPRPKLGNCDINTISSPSPSVLLKIANT